MSAGYRQYPSPFASASGLQMPGSYGSDGVLRPGAPSLRSQQAASLDSPRVNSYQSPQTPLKKAPPLMVASPRPIERQISNSQANKPPEYSGSSHASQAPLKLATASDENNPFPTFSTPTKPPFHQSISHSSPLQSSLAARVRPMMEVQDSMLFEVIFDSRTLRLDHSCPLSNIDFAGFCERRPAYD